MTDNFSSVSTRKVNESEQIYNAPVKATSLPLSAKMNFDMILNKPFFITSIPWTTTNQYNTKIGSVTLVSGILANELAKVPFLASTYYRAKVCLLLQVSGTPVHQGVLLATALPTRVSIAGDPSRYAINAYLSAPHVYLNANEGSSVCIEVPFYATSRYLPTPGAVPIDQLTYSDVKSDYADVELRVLTPLSAGTGASTTVSISVHAMFKEADFYVPITSWTATPIFRAESGVSVIPSKIMDYVAGTAKRVTGDFIDSSREVVRQWTGFHNPNEPAIQERMISTNRNFHNNVDQPNLFEVLDQHAQFNRVANDAIFETMTDEMSVSHLISKPMYIGSCTIKAADTAGTLLSVIPITPMIEWPVTAGQGGSRFYSPLRKLAESSRYWRGGLKLHIQASMSNMHYAKILVAKSYGPNRKFLVSSPLMTDVTNMMTETLEFSQGGQIQTVELPYCSSLEQLECSKDLVLNALQHGRTLVYLAQPLVFSGTVSNSINLNFFMSASDDFQFYGYACDLLTQGQVPAFRERLLSDATTYEDFIAEAEVFTDTSSQEALQGDKIEMSTGLRSDDFKPMVSVRDYVRRPVPLVQYSTTLASNKGVVCYSIADLLRGTPTDQASSVAALYNRAVPAPIYLRKMYFGLMGGLKIKIRSYGTSIVECKFVPPTATLITSSSFSEGRPIYISGTANAAVIDRENIVPTTLPGSIPVQEMPSYSFASYNGTVGYSIQENEFVVPFYNNLRFVGADANYTSSSDMPYALSMGSLIISSRNVDTSTSIVPVQVIIYIGFTDETRMGFQSYNEPLSAVTTGTVPNIRRVSLFNSPAGGPLWNPNTLAPSSYFFRV